MDIALIYMVAGMSSRFGGKVKQFAPVGKNRETLIEYSLNQAIPAGFTKIIFIVGEKTEDLFMEKFGNEYKGIPIYYAFQDYDKEIRDKPWGTTDALCTIKDIVDCPFVVCNGDDIYGENSFKTIVNHLTKPESKGVQATIGYRLGDVLPEEGTVNRGIFSIDQNSYVKGLVETFNIGKASSAESGLTENSLCSMNLFGFFPEVVVEFNNILENFKEENKGDRKIECLLPKDVSDLIQKGEMRMKIYPTMDKWYGLTNPEDEEKLRTALLNS